MLKKRVDQNGSQTKWEGRMETVEKTMQEMDEELQRLLGLKRVMGHLAECWSDKWADSQPAIRTKRIPIEGFLSVSFFSLPLLLLVCSWSHQALAPPPNFKATSLTLWLLGVLCIQKNSILFNQSRKHLKVYFAGVTFSCFDDEFLCPTSVLLDTYRKSLLHYLRIQNLDFFFP